MIDTSVAGLDLSMTATGVAHTQSDDQVCVHTIKTKGTGDDRLVVIRNQVSAYLSTCEFALIEGYLNRSMSAGITGMVHGAVRSRLIEDGIPYATVPPTSLKKYATGRGGAKKADMAVAAFKRAGLEFEDDNQCDAWWLWVMARDYVAEPVFDLPATQRDALKSVKREWIP